MKNLNNKIRNSIANSYRLRELAKDYKLTQEEKNKAYENADKIDKKILFYKNFSKALKNIKKNDIYKKTK